MAHDSLALFSWGRGNGHVTRLLSLGKQFLESGWRVTIATHNNPIHRELIEDSGIPFEIYPSAFEDADIWMDWEDRDFLNVSTSWDEEFIRRTAATRVVHDSRISTPLACFLADTPFASICQSVQLPGYRYPGQPVASIWTDPAPTVNAWLSDHRRDGIGDDIRNVYLRGRILLPSIPEMDPVPDSLADEDIVHIGPLSEAPDDRGGGTTGQGRGILFYRTVGHDLDGFHRAFGDIAEQVYIAAGDGSRCRHLAEEFRGRPAQVQALWDLPRLRPKLAAAVFHGGHGMALGTIVTSLQSVVLPGSNPERALNGERLHRLGFAEVLRPHSDLEPNWGPTVDTTGEMPAWDDVRERIDHLARAPLPPQAGLATERVRGLMEADPVQRCFGAT